MNIERPFDLLVKLKDEEVIVKTISKPEGIKAILIAFDIQINLVIMEKKRMRFIRGSDIISVEACND